MEVATLQIAEELYSVLHELVHWHESGLLGSMETADQLIANTGEPRNSLKVIPDAFVEVCLHTICIVWTLLCNDLGHFGQAYVLKH